MIASYGMAVGKTVFDTCVWIGRFKEIADFNSVDVEYIYRKDEKMNICHSMKAKDSNIRQALIDRFGPVGIKKNPRMVLWIQKRYLASICCRNYIFGFKRNGGKHKMNIDEFCQKFKELIIIFIVFIFGFLLGYWVKNEEYEEKIYQQSIEIVDLKEQIHLERKE